VKIVFLQSFENQDERIHQSSNPPKSGYKHTKDAESECTAAARQLSFGKMTAYYPDHIPK